jgi:aminomethyltransferase
MVEAHRALGATFGDAGDWRVPARYTDAEAEVAAARAAVGLADASACGKLLVTGEEIDAVLAKTAALERFAVGTAERMPIGGVPVLAVRAMDDELLLLTPPADTTTVSDVLGPVIAGLACAHVTDVTTAFAVLDVLGPRAPDLLARLSPLELAAAAPLAVIPGQLAGVQATLIRLERPAGLPAFRALVAREYGLFVWEAVTEAGHDLGLMPVGAAARARLDGAGAP